MGASADSGAFEWRASGNTPRSESRLPHSASSAASGQSSRAVLRRAHGSS